MEDNRGDGNAGRISELEKHLRILDDDLTTVQYFAHQHGAPILTSGDVAQAKRPAIRGQVSPKILRKSSSGSELKRA